MERSSKITADFILRPNFYAGSKKKKTEEDRAISSAIARTEFIQNLINSDYALCVRGVGNYSVRFYEALALGRLPLFVDTNCVLPYDFAVDWRSEMPWIGYRDRSGIVEVLVNFHDSLSEEDFQKRQRRARTLWDGWLSPDGFFRNFHMHFGPGRVPL